MSASIEHRTMRKVDMRLLPFTLALYVICYLDRANIGFAALTMNCDLGFSFHIYGLGAGAFFRGYLLLEVPGNLILERVGARRWIARIMISRGIVSGCFAFGQGPISFFTLRFLLNLAEAGFFLGMIFYFTYWFPPYHRARLIAGFMAARPVSIGFGAPISTALLGLNGVFGLAGWKWLLLAEAVPAVLLGISVMYYLMDQAAPAVQAVLRDLRKRGEDANMDRRVGLCAGGPHQEAARVGRLTLHINASAFGDNIRKNTNPHCAIVGNFPIRRWNRK